MSDQRQTSLEEQITKPPMPEAERSDLDMPFLDEAVYKCRCGIPDASGNWICCDCDSCPVGWYHWECVWVTEEPSGDWLCPSCRPKPTKDAGLWKQRREARMSMFPKLGKTATTDSVNILDREKKNARTVAEKGTRSARKGVAVKKATPKKTRSKWVGWVEITSEDEEEHKKSVNTAQKVVIVAGGRRKMASATPSKGRLTRSRTLRGTSKLVTGAKKGARMMEKEKEEEIDAEDAEDFPYIDGERDGSVQDSNVGPSHGRKGNKGHPSNRTDESNRDPTDVPERPIGKADVNNSYDHHNYVKPIPHPPKLTRTNAISASPPPPELSPDASTLTTPEADTRALRSPPNTPPDVNPHSTLALTVRHPSEVPSTPPASGAAMVIDTEEQGWTSIITSVAPDGSSCVDYWSYRTNSWCTIPLSAIRSTLPRVL